MLDDDLPKLKPGDKVHYSYSANGTRYMNGIIKLIRGNTIFVVYNCAGDWKNYREYTGTSTPISLLNLGWK